MDIGWVETTNHLTIVEDGVPTSIKKSDPVYKKALYFIRKKDKKGLAGLLHPEKILAKYSKKKVTVSKENKLVHKDVGIIEPVLADKLVEFMNKGHSFRAMDKFLANVALNPNKESASQLLEYLKHNRFPITQDGCFLAYKYVTKRENGDLVDSHTGTFNNNPGKMPSMKRDECDPSRTNTCSRGLHVAAYAFARDCGAGAVMIEVKVNPKDVVAVPNDYNNQKMRTCRYEVLKQGEEEIKESYLRIRESKPFVQEAIPAVNFDDMSGQQIIDMVKEKTGWVIPVSPKSKKSVIRYAKNFLGMEKKLSNPTTIDISKMSGQEIIDVVRNQTGLKIPLSPKSKKSIIKRAMVMLAGHGMKVKI